MGQSYDDDEKSQAEDRIARIRGGGAAQPQPESGYGDSSYGGGDALGESEALSRARSRAASTREALGADEPISPRRPPEAVRDSGSRMQAALFVVGGVVALGIVVVLILFVLSQSGAGLSLPFLATATPTSTPTPVPTETPLPTETPTPTLEAPNLALPPLTCILQNVQGCFDYCQAAENASECNGARQFITAQDADFDVFIQCMSPGPGPNVGTAQECIEEAWRSNQ